VFLTIHVCTINLFLLFDNTAGMTYLKILYSGYQGSSLGVEWLGCALTACSYLLPRLKMSRTILLHPLCAYYGML